MAGFDEIRVYLSWSMIDCFCLNCHTDFIQSTADGTSQYSIENSSDFTEYLEGEGGEITAYVFPIVEVEIVEKETGEDCEQEFPIAEKNEDIDEDDWGEADLHRLG